MKKENFEKLLNRLEIKYEKREVIKNNNVVLTGYMIGDKSIKPTIYEDMIEMNDEVQMIKILEKAVIGIGNIDDVFNKENVAMKVYIGIRNKEWNKEETNAITFDTFFDDYEGYYYLKLEDSDCNALGIMNRDEDGTATCIVSHAMLKTLNMTEKELKENAEKNMLEELSITSMFDTLRELVQGDEIPFTENEFEDFVDNSMYVATNLSKIKGAGVLGSEKCMDMIRKFAISKNMERFAILPSSIHEVLICKLAPINKKEELSEMVKEVNQTQVSRKEWLGEEAHILRLDMNKKFLYEED